MSYSINITLFVLSILSMVIRSDVNETMNSTTISKEEIEELMEDFSQSLATLYTTDSRDALNEIMGYFDDDDQELCMNADCVRKETGTNYVKEHIKSNFMGIYDEARVLFRMKVKSSDSGYIVKVNYAQYSTYTLSADDETNCEELSIGVYFIFVNENADITKWIVFASDNSQINDDKCLTLNNESISNETASNLEIKEVMDDFRESLSNLYTTDSKESLDETMKYFDDDEQELCVSTDCVRKEEGSNNVRDWIKDNLMGHLDEVKLIFDTGVKSSDPDHGYVVIIHSVGDGLSVNDDTECEVLFIGQDLFLLNKDMAITKWIILGTDHYLECNNDDNSFPGFPSTTDYLTLETDYVTSMTEIDDLF